MKKQFLFTFLFVSSITLTAQKTIRKDSISLFRITQDENTQGREIIKSKGFISKVDVKSNGLIDFSVFKQFTGYFSPEKKKGLSSGVNTIPGLTKISLTDNGLIQTDQYLLNLSSGLKSPFKYNLNEITSLTGGVSAKVIITNETSGKDLSLALKEDATAFNYEGSISESKIFGFENGSLTHYSNKFAFVPYLAQYFQFASTPHKKISIKGDVNTIFNNASENTVSYFQSKKLGGKPSIITIDSTGKILQNIDIPEIGDLVFALTSTVKSYSIENIVSSNNTITSKGRDWFFVPAPKTNLNEYVIVRVNEKGELVFKHKFNAKYDEYSYAQSAIVSNSEDSFIKIVLGKGLRYQTFFIKANKDGVSYTHLVDKDNERKSEVINSSGKSTSVGDFALNTLLTLPNGELLVGGHDYMITKETYDYSFMHLSKDGEIKKYYNTTSLTGKGIKTDLPIIYPIINKDGKILLFTKEARIIGNSLGIFGNLDREIEQGYPASTKDFLVDANANNLFVNLTNTKKEPEKASGLLGKLEKLSGGLEVVSGSDMFDSGIKKAKYSVDGETFLYAPALYVIDVNATKIQRLDFGRAGGYSIPNTPFFVFNRENNQITIISRSLPTSENSSKGNLTYPKSVFLKTTIIGL